ncbi:hypothetical protein QA596_10465 [Balneolales bacterium ANBcel1]|nr:hypothetical protein [Balneolales bacterium ANBcel1]
MKSLQITYFPFVAIAAFLMLAMTQAANPHLVRFDAEPGGDYRMVVRWEFADVSAVDESSITLQRRITSNGNKSQMINDCIRDLGGGRFECIDEDLFKDSGSQAASTEGVIYRLNAGLKNGGVISAETEMQEYTTNAARQTWGSIKSMFQ